MATSGHFKIAKKSLFFVDFSIKADFKAQLLN
jgi:hypothetical protein